MASFHNWTGDEEIATQVPQFLNEDNAATQEKLDIKFNNSLKITGAADLNSFKDEGLYYCNSNSQAETILNCPTNYAFGLMVWGKEDIFYQEVREFNRGSNQDYNNCWRRSYYSEGGQGVWSNWQQMSYVATTLAGYGITDGMSKTAQNTVSTENIMKRNVNNSSLRLMGGINVGSGASLQLCGSALTGTEGHFSLMAVDSAQSATLKGSPSGLLKWNNKNIVRSINNVAADENGNVNIVVSGGGSGGGSNITVDAEISSTSTNPVQNKAIYNALLNKVGTDIFSGFALFGGATNIRWREGTQFVGSINAANYSGTARAATHDGDGNVIVDTYAKKSDISGMVKSVNNIKPDNNGNVTIAGGGGSGGSVIVDDALSDTSTNPVQNKVVKVALDNRAVLDERNTFTSPNNFDDIYMADGISSLKWYSGSPSFVVASINSKRYTGEAYTAQKATKDGDGNVITSTYATKTELSSCVKSVNNVTPDENGNVSISVSGGGGGSNITVDAELSATSTNPVQNKVIKGALDDKANLNKNNTFSKENYFQKGMSLIAYRDLDSAIKWYQSTANPPIASIDATTYTGTAAKATSDGAGNVITETYAKKTDVSGVVKSVNGTKPDASGNVTVAVSGGGGVSTSESNTWTAQQNFRDLMLNREKYTTYVVNGTSDTPVISTMVYAVTGAFTLNLATLAGALSASQSSVFTAYFAANADYSLTISNAGKLKYTGIASDVAITTSGLLLNIWMSKDGGGTLTSIVQATKLS